MALELASQLRLPAVGDATYLAAGKLLACEVCTADAQLYAAAHRKVAWLRLVSSRS